MEEFKKIDSLPEEIDLQEDGLTLLENHAKWHKQCHQKFNNAKLERAKLKRQRKEKKMAEEMCPPKRRSTKKPEGNKVMYIFCETSSESLHEFTTFNANKSVNQMATAMCYNDLLAKLSGGDLVALEAKYHFNCLSNYRNRYRAHLRASASSSNSQCLADKRVKAQVFAEMIAGIESTIEQDNQVFKLKDLHAIYEDRLKELGLVTSINKTRLNNIIYHFLDSGIQEQTDGTNILLVFPKGM